MPGKQQLKLVKLLSLKSFHCLRHCGFIEKLSTQKIASEDHSSEGSRSSQKSSSYTFVPKFHGEGSNLWIKFTGRFDHGVVSEFQTGVSGSY